MKVERVPEFVFAINKSLKTPAAREREPFFQEANLYGEELSSAHILSFPF